MNTSWCLPEHRGRPAFLPPWLAFTQLATGALCLALVPLFGNMPLLFLGAVQRFGLDWGGLTLVRFLICALAMLGPTILFGAAFPLVARLFVDRPAEVGRQTGQIYAANTFGCPCRPAPDRRTRGGRRGGAIVWLWMA